MSDYIGLEELASKPFCPSYSVPALAGLMILPQRWSPGSVTLPKRTNSNTLGFQRNVI